MGYISYENMVGPDQLSPNEASSVIAHYTGSITEYQTGKFHVCDLCRPHLLKKFFQDFNTMTDANAQEVQETAFKLGVTPDEWRTEAQRKDRAENVIYGENPF